MKAKNPVTAQVVKLPVDSIKKKSGSKKKQTHAGSNEPVKPQVTAIQSNLSPESKSIFAKSSKLQLVALAASVPLFTAMGYGIAKSGTLTGATENSALLQGGTAAGNMGLMDVQKSYPAESAFHPGLSTSVTDDMTFQEAFDSAREELGGGNFFIWNGNLYGTFYQEEWEALTEEQQGDYLAALPQENLPDFVESFGLPPVLVIEDPVALPETIEVIDNAVIARDENGQPTLNDQQIEIIAEHDMDNMSDSEKMEMLLKTFATEPVAEEVVVTDELPVDEWTEETVISDETSEEFISPATDDTTTDGFTEDFTSDFSAEGTETIIPGTEDNI